MGPTLYGGFWGSLEDLRMSEVREKLDKSEGAPAASAAEPKMDMDVEMVQNQMLVIETQVIFEDL